MFITHDSACPVCHHNLTRTESVNGPVLPGPGDPTICTYCAAVLKLGKDMELLVCSPEDISHFSQETQKQIDVVRQVIKILRSQPSVDC